MVTKYALLLEHLQDWVDTPPDGYWKMIHHGMLFVPFVIQTKWKPLQNLVRFLTSDILLFSSFFLLFFPDILLPVVLSCTDEMDPKRYTILECDLQKFDSVRNFVDEVKKLKGDIPIDRLVCNAAVYQPSLDTAKYTPDGFEQQLQTNYLSHFLLTSLILPEMRDAPKARVIMVGSVTGNDNTVGGGGVYPIADLKEMEGLRLGAREPVSMIDGYNFNGAKAYKDTKLCLMMMANMLHEKYHRATGISFSSIYPGCIAESPLFREKRPWFRKYFPIFMRYITGGFVGEPEAGQRLCQVIVDPRCSKSGMHMVVLCCCYVDATRDKSLTTCSNTY